MPILSRATVAVPLPVDRAKAAPPRPASHKGGTRPEVCSAAASSNGIIWHLAAKKTKNIERAPQRPRGHGRFVSEAPPHHFMVCCAGAPSPMPRYPFFPGNIFMSPWK